MARESLVAKAIASLKADIAAIDEKAAKETEVLYMAIVKLDDQQRAKLAKVHKLKDAKGPTGSVSA